MSYENTSDTIPDKTFPLTLIPQDTYYCYSMGERGNRVYCPFFSRTAYREASCSYLNITFKDLLVEWKRMNGLE